MAKAKYKLGSLVQFEEEGAPHAHGIISGIITREDGYSYELDGSTDSEVAERDITAAFRPVKERKTGKRAATAARPKLANGKTKPSRRAEKTQDEEAEQERAPF